MIKVPSFDAFNMSIGDVGVALGLHIFSQNKNIARLVASVKPLRAPADLLKNVSELILIPLSGISGDQPVIDRVQKISTQTIVSVLEFGAQSPMEPNQPSGIKHSLVQAGQSFTNEMKTVIGFINGDEKNINLSDIPFVIVRPITTPISTVLSGVCNQLNPSRRNG
jgi:hypothetical protein